MLQVNDNLLDELEDALLIQNAEEITDIDDHRLDESKSNQPNATNIIPETIPSRKYIVHFICNLRSDALQSLSTAISMYSSYFIELHISISALTNDDQTNPESILSDIDNLRDCMLSHDLSLNTFVLYINIVSAVYDRVYCHLLRMMDGTLYPTFMRFDPLHQSLSLKLGILMFALSLTLNLNHPLFCAQRFIGRNHSETTILERYSSYFIIQITVH